MKNAIRHMYCAIVTFLLTASPLSQFTATAHYGGFGYAHNIFINEDTGYAYAVGSDTDIEDADPPRGGLHIIDISTPTSPTLAGGFDADGYTHDVQCVICKIRFMCASSVLHIQLSSNNSCSSPVR